ncbi:hypothetical protein AJ80_09256 [Polytolypa hystricis UAMH7299]|uniref:Extragenic suppressor of kinetochore protein 1 n=1 Tax=Polytolypa hystricis (strain UAMH7299) TaxID=1447883 RepID=A0A2B7WU21_POLH7|nr:hypothetical protein AJ80_09256 [Polytolypa hystricis UAMH7299]
MFWRFGGYANISTIDTLLERPDVSLEEVLDESELMQELKQHNTKLIEYLREDHILKRLLEYVISPSLIVDDSDDDDEGDDESSKLASKSADNGEDSGQDVSESDQDKKNLRALAVDLGIDDLENAEKSRLNYAYIASEILSSNSWSITESMMLNEGYLRDFWRFIWRKSPLDPLQSGYFTKVNEVLLEKKTEEMLAFFKSLDGVIPRLLQHVDNPMILDLILKIMSMERAEGGQGIIEWLQSQHLIPILLSYLSTEYPASTQTSAGDFFKAIITISANAAQNDPSCIGPNSLTRQLVSEPCVKTLISAMLKGGNPLTVGVGIVIEVIRKNNSDYDPELPGGPGSLPTLNDPIYLGTLLRLFASHVPDFMELVLNSKHVVNEGGQYKVSERRGINSAWGAKVEPLGFDRFKTCELMAELLHCSNIGLLNEPGSEEYVRHRDAERERMQAHGAFAHGDGNHGFSYADNTNHLENGNSPSELGSGSPEDIRKPEASHAGDEDGFEHVVSSGVLVDDGKDGFSEKVEGEDETKSKLEHFPAIPPKAPKLGMSDDFVDEPLTPPKQEASPRADLTQNASGSPAQAQVEDPTSPTAALLSEQVGSFRIEPEALSPSTSSDPTGATAVPSDSAAAEKYPHIPQSLPESSSNEQQTTSEPAQQLGTNPSQSENHSEGTDASLAEETTTSFIDPSTLTSGPEGVFGSSQVQLEANGQPVVGDYLKIMFVEHKVVPTILSFFFRFPWNNFLHNVVYDVVQQVFNGSMDRGFNRSLAIDVFGSGHITEQIVEGQRQSDEAQKTKNMRLGYMGHLTLIAEEVVRFSERHPPEALSANVMDKVLCPGWIDYVERTLSETRERDNAILGGVRPDMAMGSRQAALGSANASQGFSGSSALADAGLNGGVARSGFDSLDLMNQGSASGGVFGASTGGPSLLSGFGSSSDDEDEEMEDPDDIEAKRGAVIGSDNGDASSSTTQPIPILPPPPAPLNIPPSRARRQLAARLAQKQNAAEAAAAAAASGASSTADKDHTTAGIENTGNGSDHIPVALNNNNNNNNNSRFPISTSSDDGDDIVSGPNDGLIFSSPFSMDQEIGSSPPSYLSRFPQSATYSSDSSDGEVDTSTEEAVQRKYRLPLEVDDEGPDEMDQIVGSALNIASASSSDEDEEALIDESLGFSSYFARYAASPRREISSGGDILLGSEERHDSSDGEEEGLVEILVPARRTASN